MCIALLLSQNMLNLTMRIPALIVCFVVSSTGVFAQFEPFFPIGAESWITEYNANGPPIANYRIYVEEDTVIDGLTYTKMMRDRIFITPDETQTKLIGCFRELDGVITFYDTITHAEYEYFDQNATVGDTIASVVYPYDEFEHLGCDHYRYFIVDSLSDTTIAGVLLQRYHLEAILYNCSDTLATFRNSHIFVEEIGFLGYPTQWFVPSTFDGDFPGRIKCYEDNQLGLVKFIEEDCDFLETAIIDNEQLAINIFPNPADEYINIQFPTQAIQTVRILNNLGAILVDRQIQIGVTQITLDTHALASGVYWVSLVDGNNVSQSLPIVIE